jgi:malonate transporter
MADVIGLVLPFFGLIFLGFAVARITLQPLEALGWMYIFIIHVCLGHLLYMIKSGMLAPDLFP